MKARPAFLCETFQEVIKITRSAYGRSRKIGDIRLQLRVAESVPRKEILVDEGRVRQVNASCMNLVPHTRLSRSYARLLRQKFCTLWFTGRTPLSLFNCAVRRSLLQVLCNLVSNALKFTDVGSVVVYAWCEIVPEEVPTLLDENPTADSESHALDGKQRPCSPLSSPRSMSTRSTRSVDMHDVTPRRKWGEVLSWRRVARVEERKPPSATSFLQSLDAPGCRRAMLHVSVIDTGVGMDESQRMRLFKPFSQVCQGRNALLCSTDTACFSGGGVWMLHRFFF